MNSEILGWIGSAVVMLSYFFKDVVWLRIVNCIGCIVWIGFGILTHSLSVTVMNSIILIVHIIQLLRRK